MSLVRDKKFYLHLIKISFPIAAQYLINYGVTLTDTIMVGALGDIILSATSLANQPGFIFLTTTFGIASGAMLLISQYWGKKDIESVRDVIGIALKVSIILSFIFSFIVLVFPYQVMRIYTSDTAIIEEGVHYLLIVGYSYFFSAISSALTISLRGVEIVNVSVVVSGSSFFTNIIINYILIFGHFGMPAMGISGAALGTLCSRTLEVVILFFYLRFFDKKLYLSWRHIFCTNKALMSDYFHYGMPVILNEVLWSTGTSMYSVILGHLGSSVVAASSICTIIRQILSVFVRGISNATSVIIGKAVGEGDYKLVRDYTRTLQICYLILGLFCSLSMFSIRDFIIQIYQISDSAKLITQQLMNVETLIIFMMAYTNPIILGVLRGGGDVRFAVRLETIGIWGIAVPAGAIAGLLLHWPAPIVYACLRLDEIIKIVVTTIRLHGSRWIHNVTRSSANTE